MIQKFKEFIEILFMIISSIIIIPFLLGYEKYKEDI
jgi:hypothetical protein